MTKADIARIERLLDIELPENYKKVLAKYPKEVLDLTNLVGGRRESAADLELLNDANELIKLNERIHAQQGIDFPTEYFIVGQDGCGNYYAIDTDDEDSPVLFWNHELGEFDEREEQSSLNDFISNPIWCGTPSNFTGGKRNKPK